MGVHENVGIDKFPKQGQLLHAPVHVLFNYNTDEMIKGVIIRDDVEAPGLTVIRLADNRIVMATECMYSPAV